MQGTPEEWGMQAMSEICTNICTMILRAPEPPGMLGKGTCLASPRLWRGHAQRDPGD